MAVVTISLPDDVYQTIIDKHNSTNPNKAIVDLVKRFVDFPPKGRTIVVNEADRATMEALYGKPIDATEMRYFIEWLKARATVKVGECEVVLNAGQLKRAATNANFWGQPLEKYIADQAKKGLVATLGA